MASCWASCCSSSGVTAARSSTEELSDGVICLVVKPASARRTNVSASRHCGYCRYCEQINRLKLGGRGSSIGSCGASGGHLHPIRQAVASGCNDTKTQLILRLYKWLGFTVTNRVLCSRRRDFQSCPRALACASEGVDELYDLVGAVRNDEQAHDGGCKAGRLQRARTQRLFVLLIRLLWRSHSVSRGAQERAERERASEHKKNAHVLQWSRLA